MEKIKNKIKLMKTMTNYLFIAITFAVAIGLISIPSYLISQDTDTTSCKTVQIVLICIGVCLFLGTGIFVYVKSSC